jgi:amino acid transporter
MTVLELLLGRPLATEEESAERIGPIRGVGVFGLDALSSSAYGPEAALTILLVLGVAGTRYIVPITLSILILLAIVYTSYRQTIAAYPHGGGSYTVASQNLGVWPGLLAAAALMLDYILTVAVGISAGVGALVSAAPALQQHTLLLCLAILFLITWINLRGVRETGAVFLVPTYAFVFCLFAVIALGLARTVAAGGHPTAVVPPLPPHAAVEAVSLWLILRAFASGCTAMTGVEAVSNGVMAFREPAAKSARASLTIIIAILMLMLAGISLLVRAYRITATPPGQPGYQTVLSQLTAAVCGKGVFYFVSMASILAVLSFSANTAFADFPRLARAIARNGYLPHGLTLRGRRLVYAQGVYALAILSGVLLVIFGGVTDRLIPLFAIGAFMAFTLSQAGMVRHWQRVKGPGWRRSILVNGLGALATALTSVVVLVAKFTEGAWITVLLIPGLMILMRLVRRHYDHVTRETRAPAPVDVDDLKPPLVVMPVARYSRITQKALRFAWSVSPQILVLHIECGDGDGRLPQRWHEMVEEPARRAGLPVPQLVVLQSPFRFVVQPILDYVLNLEEKYPDRQIAVLVPELVESRWIYNLLHNNRPTLLKALLLLKGKERVMVINIPWYLHAKD